MAQNRSRSDLMRFLDYIGEKGLVSATKASARKTAVSKVLAVLDDEESEDVIGLDIDEVMSRFNNLHPHQFAPESLQAYRSLRKGRSERF